jgi:hypothetical protein
MHKLGMFDGSNDKLILSGVVSPDKSIFGLLTKDEDEEDEDEDDILKT